MTQATAAITDNFKNTFVRVNSTDEFVTVQKLMHKLGFKHWMYGREIDLRSDIGVIYVNGDCEMVHNPIYSRPGHEGWREVTAGELASAAEQVRKIKREEHKESKKRKAKRNWEATATQNDFIGCPVRRDAIVSYKQRNGSIYTTRAGNIRWTEQGYDTDVISYKVIGLTPKKPASKVVSVDTMFADIASSVGKGVAWTSLEEVTSLPVGDERVAMDRAYDAACAAFAVGGEVPADMVFGVAPDTNPKRQYGVSSIPLNMWSPLASAYGALGLYNGSLKYGKANFANTKVEASIYIAAAMRHLNAWAAGQEDDPADGVPNLGGVLANIAILLEARAAGMLIDDRLLMSGYLSEIETLKEKVKALNELHAGKNPRHYTREQA